MSEVSTNSLCVHYETFGLSTDPSIVLIMGLGEQMVAWPTEFCRMLVDQGFYVIRFDNRDTGYSTQFGSCGIPDLFGAWDSYFNATPITPPYSLQDMAADVNGLLEDLNIEKSYICGFSLGGMIAQNMAFIFPERMAGMICIGSSTGERTLPPPTPEAHKAMATPPPETRESFIDHTIDTFRSFSGGSPYYDPCCRAEIAALTYDRCFYPEGFMRQSVAMLADGERTERLRKIHVPTLVLHGEMDPVAQPIHGKAITESVPNAEFGLLSDWGHGFDYPELWPSLVQYIVNFIDAHPS